MSTNETKIIGICCHYTARVPEEALKEAGVLPGGVRMEHLPCTGRVEVPALLAAFEKGADAVFVAGCEADACHNLSGSHRASKRVRQTKVILEELDVNPERVEMFFVARGEMEPVVAAAREMSERVGRLGPLFGTQAKAEEGTL